MVKSLNRGLSLASAAMAAVSTLVLSVQLAMSVYPDRREKVDSGNSPMVNTAVASLAPIVVVVILGGVMSIFYHLGELALEIVDSVLHKMDRRDINVTAPKKEREAGHSSLHYHGHLYDQVPRYDHTRANNLEGK
mgnify:CR=1 FL=1